MVLKDTFQCTQSYDEVNRQQRITGRRVLSTKKLLYLPFNRDSNYDRHDLKQSKLKNMVIDELKSFFINRNKNHQQENDDINIQLEPPITKQLTNVIICKTNQNSKQLLSIPASTTLFASFSILTNIFLSDILSYSTSFTFGCFGAQCIKQAKFLHIHRFGNIFTRSLLLHTCLTVLIGGNSFSQRSISKHFLFIRQDILIRIITSISHLIAEFTIDFDDKNII